MALVMEMLSDSVLPVDDADLFAQLQYGSNGVAGGTPELSAGNVTDDPLTGSLQWDDDLSDGLDSGLVSVELVVRTGEESILYLSVGGQEVTYLGQAYSNLVELELRTAVVNTQASIAWSDLSVSFFYDDNTVDEWSTENGPALDQTQSADPVVQEKTLKVKSEKNNVNEIRFSGKVKITAPQGVALNANSVFGQVLINDDVA